MHHEQQPQYRYVGPPPPPPHQAEPHHQQPSTSANPSTSTSSSSSTLPQGVMHPIPIQMRPSTSSTSSSAATRPPPSLVRIGHGHPIKLGENILQPAGTLVFSSQGDGGAWTSGQRVLVHAANKHNVVQANLYPIGMTLQTANGNWYLNQHPVTTTATSSSNNAANTTNSSATPDSGIQSVPTSPPSPRYEMTNEQERYGVDEEEEEDDDDPADFTDMPTLKPADEDDCYDMPSTSAGPPVADQTSPTIVNSHIPSTSTATAPTPREDLNGMNPDELFAISIEKNMDLDEIVQRLINFDPEKAAAIAMLIKKKCAEEVKKKKDLAEAEVSSTTPTTPRAVRGTTRKRTKVTRNTNSPDVTTSAILPEEHSTVEPDGTEPGEVELEEAEVKTPGKRRGRKPKKRRNKDEENAQESPGSSEPAEPVKKMKQSFAEFENPTTSCSPPSQSESVQFRLKVRKMMERQLEVVTERMAVDMTELRLGHGHGHGPAPTGKRKESFFRQLAEQSKKIKKGNLPKRLKMFMAPEEKTSQEPEDVKPIKEEDVKTDTKPRGRLPSSRRSRVEDSEEKLTSVEEKFNGEYYEISRSVIPPGMTDEVLPLWKASNLTCGCTKGGCTSDMDCLNRAMRVQCSSECTLPYCSNRKFWKEDQNKLCVSNGPKSLRALKTRVARRAGEFLCEYAGEMITCQEAVQRSQEKPDSRIIAIGPQLFVDATTRANIARFVKHSCRPNCRLEVWSVNGVYRAGVFALVDLAANVDITVDKSHWIPCDQPCKCLAIGCKKTIRGVNMRFFNAPDDSARKNKSVFLARNRRSTLHRYQSGLPAILQSPNTSDAESSALQQMKKVLAAFIYRYRRVDGSLPRSSLPFYTSICKFLKNSRPNARIDEFNGLFRKWLEKIDDDDLERAFNAIKSHYLNPQLVARSKKQKENAPRARAPSTSCQPSPIPRSNADLSYLDSIHPIGSYDPDAAWEAYRAKPDDNAVRCICGALDEDGQMVQCDSCSFWLHVDCCEYEESAGEEYKCDFCQGKMKGNRPTLDVKLTGQLDVRFEHCDYYRSLMNRRGIQVRLNETVYVSRILPEKHKEMLRNLREEKKGAKTSRKPNKEDFPDAPTDPLPKIGNVDRKETRIFRVERLFVCPGNNRFVFGSFYAWPHETYAETGRNFSKKEVFATPYYETLPLDEVIGRCLVVDTATWSEGRPKVPKFKEDDVFLCEMQIGKNQRFFEKIPQKNRYPINTQPYVFTKFSQPKKILRNFRPYPVNPSPRPPKTPVPAAHQSSSSTLDSTSSASRPDADARKASRRNISRLLDRVAPPENKQCVIKMPSWPK